MRKSGVRFVVGFSVLLVIVAMLTAFHFYKQGQQEQAELTIRDMARASDEIHRGFLHLHLGGQESPWQYEIGKVLIQQAVQQYRVMEQTMDAPAALLEQLNHLHHHLETMLESSNTMTQLALLQAMYHHTQEVTELDRQIRLFLEQKSSRLNWLFNIAMGLAVLMVSAASLLLFRADKARLRAAEQLVASEARFRELTECVSDVLWLFDVQSKQFIYLSSAYERVWGLPRTRPEDASPWYELIHEEDRERVLSAFKSIQSGAGVAGGDEVFRIKRQDGNVRWLHSTAYPVLNKQGQVIRVAGISRDITERFQDREQLHLLSTAVGRLNDIVMITEATPLNEPGPRVIFVSDSFEKITGYRKEEIIGRSPRLLQGAGTEIEELCRVRQALERGEAINARLTNYRKDGSEIYIELQIAPILDGHCNRTHWVSVIRDITHRRAMEYELQHAQRMEAIGHLSSGLAHDFNNLLTVILGNADLLAEQLHDARLVGLARLVSMAAQRGAELTQQMLAFARHQVLAPKVLDPLMLLHELFPLLKRSVGHHVGLYIEPINDIPAICVDPTRFENALLNICINARDAMPTGGSIRITVRSVELGASDSNGYNQVIPGRYVEISVIDTGMGIAPELFDKIFDPFFTTKSKERGTGLGLSMVFGFIKQSEGHIDIRSVPGKGTSIHLYLPVSDEQPEAINNPEVVMDEDGTRASILVVEDDDLVRQYVHRCLEDAGHQVVLASNGREALEVLDQGGSFDLLFTDVLMPEMGGLDLAKVALQRLPNMKVIYSSGFYEEDVLEQLLSSGRPHLLAKPYRSEELLSMVARVLSAEPGSVY